LKSTFTIEKLGLGKYGDFMFKQKNLSPKERERRKLKRSSIIVHLLMAGTMAILHPLILQEPRIYTTTKYFVLFSTTGAIGYIFYSLKSHLNQINDYKLSYVIG